MRATLRWAHADLRTHRGEALFLVLATTGIVASLLLATAFFGYATNPWQRVFTQSHGAHVWIHTSASGEAQRLSEMHGLESVTGPFPTAATTLANRGTQASVELRGVTEQPETSRPLLTAGHWLDQAQSGGIVLESSLARALWAEPGDTLTVPGTSQSLTVLGVAESAEPRYNPGEQPGLVWALPSTVHSTAGPDGQVIGLRLTDSGDTDYAVQRAVTILGADAVTQVSSWQQARAQAQGDNRLLGEILGLFGLGSLVAAGLAVHGAISTRVRGHLRDISVLKAIGFTPSQVVRIFLLQHLAVALLGAALASGLARSMGSRIPGRLGDAVRVWQGLPGHTAALFTIPAAVVLFISATTGLAAWRAGRVSPVPGTLTPSPSSTGLSRAARVALALPIPPALVLGWHKAFARPTRSLVAVARLALPLLLIVVAMSAWTTINRFHSRPETLGLAALSVRPDGTLNDPAVQALLNHNSEVAGVHPGVQVPALVPGQTGTIDLQGIGVYEHPYPFSLAEGRQARGPDEAVAGQGLLDLLNVHVGDWVRMTVGAQPQILHIVGRNIEPENGGRVISTSLDTLRENDPALKPTLYLLTLHPGADPQQVATEIASTSRGHLDVHTVINPAEGLSPLRAVAIGLVAVLALVGLIELLTAIGGTIRESELDLLALKAIGLTPRQITSITVTATALTAFAAVVLAEAVGAPLAQWLINAQSSSNGIGAGVAQRPSVPLLLVTAAGPVLGAIGLAALPATRAAAGGSPTPSAPQPDRAASAL